MNTYDLGEEVRISSEFTVLSGDDGDPLTVTVTRESPSGVSTVKVYGTNVEVVRDSAGNFHLDFIPNEVGRWWYRWQGTGINAVEEGQFLVRGSRL